MKEKNIVCATDNNFVQHCVVMLVSYLRYNHNSNIYILTEGLSEKNILIINSELKEYNCSFKIINVKKNLLSALPMPKGKEFSHISIATYYRLFLSSLLPQSISTVLYLDCDIIVNTSLDNLFDLKLDNYAIAAVSHYTGNENSIRLGIDVKFDYFNAGVLLVNLNFWRKNSIEKKFTEYISENAIKIKYHDQDVLNAVLHTKRLPLSPKYNFLYPFFNKNFTKNLNTIPNESENFISDINEGLSNSKIVIHYTSSPKPWNDYCIHPLRKDYFTISRLTKNFKNIYRPSFLFSEILVVKNQIKSYILNLIK